MAEYIEREALMHHFADRKRFLTKDLVLDAAYEISKFPAADVAEVRHGRWEYRPFNGVYDASCSVCGFAPVNSSTYCPDCGAQMDGGAENAATAKDGR